MARRYTQEQADAEQLPVALDILDHPEKSHPSQLLWARLFMQRIERERRDRAGQPAYDGQQALLFPAVDTSRYSD